MTYEVHITMKSSSEIARQAVEGLDWKFSCIDGDPALGDHVFCYATKHFPISNDLQSIIQQTNITAKTLSDYAEVVRQKVELIVYDTRVKI